MSALLDMCALLQTAASVKRQLEQPGSNHMQKCSRSKLTLSGILLHRSKLDVSWYRALSKYVNCVTTSTDWSYWLSKLPALRVCTCVCVTIC